PAYYIMKGIGKRWYANLFAILITITFSLAFSSVQSNTMAIALKSSFGVDPVIFGAICSLLTLLIICGGIQRIAKFNEIIVPIMALMYIGLAVYVVITRITMFPHVMALIFENAFGFNQALGGTLGMAVIQGVKRGLFSNEAGEGSTPNAAATAAVSHPVKQGLIQTLGVFTDTLFVCSATAFIILCSGVFDSGLTGIELTQRALENEVGSAAVIFVALAVIMFAFSSILANYFFGEANLRFINPSVKIRNILRVCVAAVVMIGAIVSLEIVWAIADITMAMMALCNIIAIIILGRYSFLCLKDYRRQIKEGKDPVYRKSVIPEIADKTECWPD
ncbi:MAG: alanine:cation symporter family protein, partial [Muribaculaceae bacterium]|nr:alanine:cation symporter family protein [Muribaculaceae bacterium]